MDDLAYWTAALRKAEQELDGADARSAINAAAKRVMLVKRELKRLEKSGPSFALGPPPERKALYAGPRETSGDSGSTGSLKAAEILTRRDHER